MSEPPLSARLRNPPLSARAQQSRATPRATPRGGWWANMQRSADHGARVRGECHGVRSGAVLGTPRRQPMTARADMETPKRPRSGGAENPPDNGASLGLGTFKLQRGIATLLVGAGAQEDIHVVKGASRVGLALFHELPERAVVRLVHPGSAAALSEIGMFDEILQVNDEAATSAQHAVGLIRDAEPGLLKLRVRRCPRRLVRAAATLQRAWLRALFAQFGLQRATLHKPSRDARLGVSFSSRLTRSAVIEKVSAGGLAAGVVATGDRICSIDGARCDSPSVVAHLLRESDGEISLLVQRATHVDPQALRAEEAAQSAAEAAAEAEEAEAAAAVGDTREYSLNSAGGRYASDEDDEDGEDDEEFDEDDEDDEEDEEEEDVDAADGGAYSAGLPERGAWGVPRPDPVSTGAGSANSSAMATPDKQQVVLSGFGSGGQSGGGATTPKQVQKQGSWLDWLIQKRAVTAPGEMASPAMPMQPSPHAGDERV